MTRRTNPGRPPRRWFARMVREVKAAGGADDPAAVVGAIWYHQLSAAKRKALIAEERQNPAVSRQTFDGLLYVLVSVATTRHDADVAKATLQATGHLVRVRKLGRAYRIFARSA